MPRSRDIPVGTIRTLPAYRSDGPRAEPLLRQAAEGDRPARHFHGGDAVLPFMARLAGQMIDRPRREKRRDPIVTAAPASPEPHRRRGSERDAENMLEYRPVSVPPNSSARVVTD